MPYDRVHLLNGQNYNYDVAMGRVGNATTWNKFGYNLDVDTGATETIWSPGGRYASLNSADTLVVTSSDAADDGNPAGTGANSVIIYGVDANFAAQTEVVTLNGISGVTTSSSWRGVNRVANYLVGSGGTNAGTITITATTGGATHAQLPAGQGTTQQCIFFTQAGYTALADWLFINCNKIGAGSEPIVTIKGWVKSLVSNSMYEVFRMNIDTAVENTIEISSRQPFVIGEKSMLEFTADTTINNTIVTARFSLIEIKNT